MNVGATGASFHVTSRTATGGPWTYTVGAGRELSGSWTVVPGGPYELSVYGPNGYLRTFAGRAGVGAEVRGRHDAKAVAVRLTLTNTGSEPVRLTVANAYGDAEPKAYQVRQGSSVTVTVPAGDGHGWYDVSVTSSADGTYLRRLAGHVETGGPSTSDPAHAG